MNKKSLFFLSLIFLLGFIVRVWQIDKVPPGLNRDEASIGYTAYSLLKTGNDEYGTSWPFSFKSFGDWKLPFYIYLTIPFVKLFGLTDAAVRMPSVLFGSLTVIVVYFLSKILFRNENSQGLSGWMAKIPLLGAFLFSLSPWSIHLSRNASESNTAVFFTAAGTLLFLKTSQNKLYRLLGTIFLLLPLYTYHGNHIFSLLFFIGLIIFCWKKSKSEKSYWLSISIFILFSLFIYSKTLLIADRTKISGLFALGDTALVYEKVTLDRLQHENTTGILTQLRHNKATLVALSAFQNYFRSFSPEFLFITGGGNTQHNIPDFGNLYLWTAPFLLLGFTYLLWSKNENKRFILFWLLIAPLAASITKDAPHTNRMAPVLPVFELLIAYGFIRAASIIFQNRKIFASIILSVLVLLFIGNFTIWIDRYFIHFPQKRASIWGEGYTRLTSYLSVNNNFAAKEIVMSRPEYSPYIYFLFYNKLDPLLFQNSVVRYPETNEGFQHVEKIGDLTFRQIDWSDDLKIPNRLYIDWSGELPKSATFSSTLITNEIMDDLIRKNKDVSDLKIGDLVISQKITEIMLQNKESMFTLIKTAKGSSANNFIGICGYDPLCSIFK